MLLIIQVYSHLNDSSVKLCKLNLFLKNDLA
uniref:Uncharacterized protein n=1 Tax=Arundo donax TaxID=35708 RepID=A0A0A9B6W8_ARUDO